VITLEVDLEVINPCCVHTLELLFQNFVEIAILSRKLYLAKTNIVLLHLDLCVLVEVL
jgi:hypothetical protein